MAKQDLVVKLLLDSGAFGNDLRTAERKAKDFKENMNRAGGAVGDIGKTIGGSLGGVTKVLGGIAAGAGVAVAAFEGFKSVMNSTNETAKIFNGTIAGFESVLDTFQRSLAKMDFSGFINGIDEVYARGKRWKELQQDVNLATVAYNFLNARDVEVYKEYEKQFRNAKTDEDKAKVKADVAEHLSGMRDNVLDYVDIVNEEFIAGIEKMEKMFDADKATTIFGDLENHAWDGEKIVELIYQAMQNRLSNPRTGAMDTDIDDYKDIMADYKLWAKKVRKGIGWKGQTRNDVIKAQREKEKIERKYQELFFRNALYEYTEEELNAALAKIINSINQDKAITELEITSVEWGGSSPKEDPKITPIVKNADAEIEILKNSISDLKKELSIAEKTLNGQLVGTEKWWAAQAEVEKYTKLLNEALLKQAKLLHPMEPLPSVSHLVPQKLEAPDMGLAVPKAEETPVIKDIESIISNVSNLNTVLSSSVMLINGMGDAFANCEDESMQKMAGVADVLATVGTAAMSLAQIYQTAIATNEAYAASVALGQAATLPFPANIAAIATVVGTLISVVSQINQIKNAGKFAEGGIVGGTSFSGDKLFAMVNSGEMILNKRQQGNLANMIGGGGNQVEFHISGDSLVGVLNNKRNKTNLIR